jgi:hypothetical protein
MYQGSLAEIFVPYQDPGPNWFYRTYMDAGEFGFGLLASPLTLGLDVPENAVLLDGLVAAAIPDPALPVIPLPLRTVIGVFERPDRQPGVAPLRAVRQRRLRGPCRGRAGGSQHRPARQLRLPARLDLHPERRDTGRDRPHRHRRAQGRRRTACRQRPALRLRRWRPSWWRRSTATTSTSASTSTSTGRTTASSSAS